MTRAEHIAHLESRLAEATQLNDRSMIEMIRAKLANLKGGQQ